MSRTESKVITAFILLVLASTCYLRSNAVRAEDGPLLTVCGDSWKTAADGVVAEWNKAGEVRCIYSRQSEDVISPNQRGIEQAQAIAEEKAKAAIVKLLGNKQVSTSSMPTSQSTTTQHSATLKGLAVLGRGYNSQDGAAWVVVGIGRQ
jgi:hypothetical protein